MVVDQIIRAYICTGVIDVQGEIPNSEMIANLKRYTEKRGSNPSTVGTLLNRV
jgi:hypothetical protein